MQNKYHVTAEIIIQSPIQKVWEVMTETSKYPQWNGFIKKINTPAGKPVAGTAMQFEVEFSNGSKAKSGELVKVFQEPALINNSWQAEWIYDFTGPLHAIGMVRASRTQKLTGLSNGYTHFYTCEKFSGWGRIFLPLAQVQAGFIQHAGDLKAYCEHNYPL
jgi:uncharacterized protein YndB with AHSA1/START domain